MNKRSLSLDLFLATRNKGKTMEFEQLLAPLGWRVRNLLEFPELPDVVEDGDTFEANALKKACEIQERIGGFVLADDSGLCVDALEGRPGVYSARYAGEPPNDHMNNVKLLQELEGVPMDKRGAKFVCVLVLARPDDPPLMVRGEVNGYIVEQPQGDRGFGYDPLFYLPEFGKTMGELGAEMKNRISHRSKAMEKLKEQL